MSEDRLTSSRRFQNALSHIVLGEGLWLNDEVAALEIKLEMMVRAIKAVNEYVNMLEYCTGGLIAEFGATKVRDIMNEYRLSMAAVQQEPSNPSPG